MKRQLLIALILSVFTTFCYSQVKVNVQAGTGLTGVTKNENYNANLGYRFGIGVELPINRTWSMQTGLQILNRSYSMDKVLSFVDPPVDGTLTYTALELDSKTDALYLQVPIKIAAYLPLNDNCGLQLSAGPYIAYGVGDKNRLKWTLATQIFNQNDLSHDIGNSLEVYERNEELEQFDLGLSLGVDFKYKRFFAGIGAEYGFRPIGRELPKDITKYVFEGDETVVSPRNIGIELHVGFSFSTGK